MNILGIETSCDETAAAIVKNGREILSSVVSSQIKSHQPYKGVVPELASREHLTSINRVLLAVLKQANFKQDLSSLDAIGVTVGPGLAGALLVGKMTAETLGWIHQVPVFGVNHIEGHLLSPLLSDPSIKPPFIGLVVSGGHTEIIYTPKWGQYFLMGRTRDDAAGEAFDKVAKMMGLGYPGGPVIDRMAMAGDASKQKFPRAWLPRSWDFSFSGLKTSVLYRLQERKKWTLSQKKDLCAGFQSSVVDVLVTKTMAACKAMKVYRLVVGGGVAANSELRRKLHQSAKEAHVKVSIAPPVFCTDNAAMIASSTYFKIKYGKSKIGEGLSIQPQLHIPFISTHVPAFEI